MIPKKHQSLFLLVVAFIYVATRFAMVYQKTYLLNDEIASRIVMSGKGVSVVTWYKEAQKKKVWLNKEQIIDEMDIDDAHLNLQGVSEMLEYNDIHPPLYFWIGNAWCSVFGFGVKSVLWLHLLFEILTLLLIYRLLNQFNFYSRVISMAFALIIITHPFFSESFILIRHYSLLALLSTSLLFSVFNYYNKAKAVNHWLWILFGVVFLGSLTHFIFTTLVFAILTSILAVKKKTNHFFMASIASLLAFALAAALNWDLFKKLILLQKTYDNSSLDYYLNYLAAIPSRIILTRRMVQFLPTIILVLSWVIIPWFIVKSKKESIAKALLLFVFAHFIIIIALVILDKTPFHSLVSNRYYVGTAAASFIALFLLAKNYLTQKTVWIIGSIFCIYGGLLSTYQARKPMVENMLSEKAYIVEPGLMYLGLTAQIMNTNQQVRIISLNEIKDLEQNTNHIIIADKNIETLKEYFSDNHLKITHNYPCPSWSMIKFNKP
ncbi:MAG: glycosyltransferase family 39 protein [Bacteroidia bacterium]